jgi:hypothetical protein
MIVRTLLALSLMGTWASDETTRHSLQARGSALFEDDFESGLDKWTTYGVGTARVRASGDAAHGDVLELVPNGDAYALIKGSERFGAMRIEGEVLFLDETDNYLGVIYNFGRRGQRTDFGVIYIKGNDSYLQANPHRDFNVSRTIYPEFRAALSGSAAIRAGHWQRFAVEVVGGTAHFYVGQTSTPQLTFAGFERESGAIGLQPRSVGGDVWVDNVRVTPIQRLSYRGPAIPAVQRHHPALLSEWMVAGPFPETDDRLARNPAAHAASWRPFSTDERGAVVTGRVVDYHGPNTVAYFRARVPAQSAGAAELRISTADDAALWVNGRFHWFIPRADTAWFDFLRNPARKPLSIPLDLVAGVNELVFRVRGGVYASGGLFAAVVN